MRRVAIDLGLREEWFAAIDHAALAPRISVAWSPFANDHTKLSAGYAVIYEPPNLALLGRALDQQAITTPYTLEGVPETPLTTTFLMGSHLKAPRYANWSGGLEHDFGHSLSAKAEWLRKRGRDGLVYAPEVASATVDLQPQVLGYGDGGTYVLSNQRRDEYDDCLLYTSALVVAHALVRAASRLIGMPGPHARAASGVAPLSDAAMAKVRELYDSRIRSAVHQRWQWRTHSCVPHPDSSGCPAHMHAPPGVAMSGDAARTSAYATKPSLRVS